MRIVSSLVVVALAAPSAVAQPVTNPAQCAVTIARAPEDVAKVVDAWVKAEPRCATSLEVRIVPTEGGLYLFARDEHGRVRERIVPDAQSAGVLVASWAADDAMPAPPAPGPAPAPIPVPVPAPGPAPTPDSGAAIAPEAMPAPAPTPMSAPEPIVAPGMAPAVEAYAPVIAPAPPARSPRWLTLGGLIGMNDGGGAGVRGELDIRSWRKWSAGVAASFSDSTMMLAAGDGWMDTSDAKVIGYLARSSQRGRWHLRSAIGIGMAYTKAKATMSSNGWQSYEADGMFPAGEASLVVARELGNSWAIHAGPVVTLFAQSYAFLDTPTSTTEVVDRNFELMLFAGVRHRL